MPERTVLLVGHGTIADLNDVPEFLLRIRRGRPADAALIAEIRRRYGAIGQSPLLNVTLSLARELETRVGVPSRVAMRFWNPLVPDVLRNIVDGGCRELCVLPVAPFSVHVYAGVVAEEMQAHAVRGISVPKLVPVEPYGEDPSFVAAQAAMVAPLLAARDRDDTELVLTAHSLPSRVLASGDPYQRLFENSAAKIAGALGWSARVAYQSQGADGGEWLGPTLDAALEGARARGKTNVVVAPVGFLADHVETLYDLDVEAAARAESLGLGFSRAPALGDDPRLVDALAGIVKRAFE